MRASGRASAVAHANIALCKYWGKQLGGDHLAAVPSLSLTLEALATRTTVHFDAGLPEDDISIDGRPAGSRESARVRALLDRVRARGGLQSRARVVSSNDFPTAAGLASSASGFAALALASLAAAGLPHGPELVSRLARESSVSAARSAFGGFATLAAGAEAAAPLAVPNPDDYSLVIAVTARGPKSVGSSEGMELTRSTSPYYGEWVRTSPGVFEEVRTGLLQGDLARAGAAMEHSTLLMHACMMSARPGLIYWRPATLAALAQVRQLQGSGLEAFFTMDAGPHVKVLTRPARAERVAAALKATPGVERVIVSGPGQAARRVEAQS